MIKKQHFDFTKREGFACIKNPMNITDIHCMSKNKGRKHPDIDKHILEYLGKLYKQPNDDLFKFLNIDP